MTTIQLIIIILFLSIIIILNFAINLAKEKQRFMKDFVLKIINNKDVIFMLEVGTDKSVADIAQREWEAIKEKSK